jgi:tetratricopeptide (TPR) repeat protein
VIRRIPVRDTGDDRSASSPADHLAVRWVVRYGVVPRRLTLDFVGHVLLPFLLRALSGRAEAEGDDFIEEIRGRRDWRPEPGRTWDVETIWRQLTAYATSGNHGWITVDAGDPPRARLHPDVILPMRRLLRRQAVYARLQEAARDYFAARGATVDVLFHDLQLAPERALEDWRAAFDQPRLRQDAAARGELAEALLTSDFETAPPAARAFAHYKAAWALAATVNYTLMLPDHVFDRAWQHLESARDLEADAGVVPGITWHCLDVVSLFRAGRQDQAIDTIGRLLAAPGLRESDRTCLLLHRAEMHVRMGRTREAEADFEAALASSVRDPRAVVPLWAIHDRLGHRLARRGEWTGAAAHYEAALAGLRDSSYRAKYEEVFRALVLLDLSMGRPARAHERLQAGGRAESQGTPAAPPQARDLRARAALATLRPGLALSALRGRDGQVDPQLPDGPFLSAEACTELLEFDQALKDYRRGEAAASGRGDTAAAERHRVALARMYVRVAGNIDEAAILFDGSPMRTLEQDPTLRAEWTVLRACVAERQGRDDASRQLLSELVSAPAPGQSPHQQVYGWLAQLALGHVDLDGDKVRELTSGLESIAPATARLSLLEAVSLGGPWTVTPGTDVTPLVDTVLEALEPAASGEPPDPREHAVHVLAAAELLKALGRIEEMERLFASVTLPADEEAFVFARLRLAIERQLREHGHPIPTPIEERQRLETLGDLASRPDLRRLVAACAIELAGARLAEGASNEDVSDLLPLTKPFLEPAAVQSDCHRRARELRDGGRRGPGAGTGGAAALEGRVSTEPMASMTGRVLGLSIWAANASDPAAGYFVQSEGDRVAVPAALSLDRGRLLSDARDEAALLADSWKACARRLASVLLAAPPAAGRHFAPVWLDGEPELSALAWELAALAEPRRFSGVLRVPGVRVIGPPETPGNRAPVVLVLDARFMQDREVMAGQAYAQLPRTLEAAGARVRLEQRFDIEVLPKLVADTRPDLVVLVAALEETSGNVGWVRFGNYPIDASVLHHSLTPPVPDHPEPSLILDVPAPGSQVETAAQLLTRNRFAFELCRHGKLHAVLATGLGHDAPQERLHQAIAAGIAAGDRMGALLAAIRDAGTPAAVGAGDAFANPDPLDGLSTALHDILPFFATALFTRVPREAFVATARPE